MTGTASVAEREQTRRRPSIARQWLFPSLTDLFFIITFGLTFLLNSTGWDNLVRDGDTGMHIRAGDYILATRHVPTQDLFSFSRAGQPWADWEWLSQAVFALLHHWWGLKGVVLFSAVLVVAVFTLLMRQALWRGANSILAFVLVFLAINMACVHLLARPHIFTLLFLMVTMFLIAADRRRRSAAIWLLLPIATLWANLHGGFAILFPILGLLVLGSAVEGYLYPGERALRWSDARRYAVLGLGTGLASLVNPYGIRLHLHILDIMSAKWLLNVVTEFASPSFRSEQMLVFMALLFLSLAVVVPLIQKRKMTEALWIVFFAYCGLMSIRHVPLFALAVVPIVAEEISSWWEGWTRFKSRDSVPRVLSDLAAQIGAYFGPVTLWIPIFLLAVALGGWVRWPTDIYPLACPSNLIARHASQIESARILTPDQWGDYLIYHYYPRVRVFIDGRSDFYGERIIADYLKISKGQHDWKQLVEQYRFDMVLCPVDWALASLLKYQPDWLVVEDDGKVILFQREAARRWIGSQTAAAIQSESPNKDKVRQPALPLLLTALPSVGVGPFAGK